MPVKLIQKIEMLILGVMVLLIITQCEDFLPNDYHEESYRISSQDMGACDYLFRDFFRTDTVVVDEDTSYVTDTLYVALTAKVMADVVDTSMYRGQTDLEIIKASFAEVLSGLDEMVADTTLGVSNPSLADTSYLSYEHIGGSKRIKVYGGWIYEWLDDLNADNLDGYLDIDFIKSDGTLVARDVENISLEMASGCTQYVEWRDNYFPRIKVDNEYVLEGGSYVVRIIIPEPEKMTSYRLMLVD